MATPPAADAPPPAVVRVRVAYSPAPRCVEQVELTLPAGATLGDALHASGFLQRHPGVDLANPAVGIWGRRRTLDARLCDGDRVELYRPLTADPKEARRRRQRLQREQRAASARPAARPKR